jgi:hypothetical protein
MEKRKEILNHFLYEVFRNPLGPVGHCAELVLGKSKALKYKNLKDLPHTPIE